MRISIFKLTGMFLALLALNVSATTHYVDLNSPNPTSPFTDWTTAATNIQTAISSSLSGDIVLVTNGIYQTGGLYFYGSNRIALTISVTVQSVNGPGVTIIQGYQVPSITNGNDAVRCAYLSNGAKLSGFTLTIGATRTDWRTGGGILCQDTTSVVTNCIISGNVAYGNGGGVYLGTLFNCVVTDNLAVNGGGVFGGILNNCLVVSNTSTGAGGGAASATLNNCTLVGNYAATIGGGAAYSSTLNNSIAYYNRLGVNFPPGTNVYSSTLNASCFAPFIGAPITGNLTNAPQFVNLAGSDFHLASNSPCINAGGNPFVSTSSDFDGKPRTVAVVVDIGAYEFQIPPPVPVHYVNLKNTNSAVPYASWQTAAASIQNAIDFATNGDLIIVSNGVYQTAGRIVFGAISNRVVVAKPLILQSLNGPGVTTIAGNPVLGSNAVRCVYLTNGASLIGFTLANGGTSTNGDTYKEQSGGGVWCASITTTVSNCIITGNSAKIAAGGAYLGKLFNCMLSNNVAASGGGGYSNVLFNCVLVTNTANSFGGGAFGATLTSCLISNNLAVNGGGGCAGSTVNRSLLVWNRGIGGGGGAYAGTLNNCLVYFNNRSTPSGVGGGAFGCSLNNCTIVNNGVSTAMGGGTDNCFATNSIIYYNSGQSIYANDFGSTLDHCCITPVIGPGVGNFSSSPGFADSMLHLDPGSPCLNTGLTANAPVGGDYDGRSRIVDGMVDVGAQEYQGSDFEPFVLWLYQYGLANDGSADFVDPDEDGSNNWAEWIAGTVPTNTSSVLKMYSPIGQPTGLDVTWQSVSGKTYFLQRSTNLLAQPAFTSIQSNLVGAASTTTYSDTTATNGGPYFYRIGVQ